MVIIPFSGCWGVQEVLRQRMGSEGVAAVRTLGTFKTLEEAKAYLEGFMAGDLKREKSKYKKRNIR